MKTKKIRKQVQDMIDYLNFAKYENSLNDIPELTLPDQVNAGYFNLEEEKYIPLNGQTDAVSEKKNYSDIRYYDETSTKFETERLQNYGHRLKVPLRCITQHGREVEFGSEMPSDGNTKRANKIFSNLINNLRYNPNCSYKTYANDILKEQDMEYLSVLMKAASIPVRKTYMEESEEMENNSFLKELSQDQKFWALFVKDDSFREVLASRIMNFFEVPTSYEELIKVAGDYFVLSVDFARYDEDIYSLATFTNPLGKEIDSDVSSYGDVVDAIKTVFEKIDDEYTFNGVRVELPEDRDLESEYIYSYLVRRWLLCDKDYNDENIAVVVDKKTQEIKGFLNFDFEYALQKIRFAESVRDCEEELSKIRQDYPDAYDKFISKLDELNKKQESGKSIMEEMTEEIALGDNIMSIDIKETLKSNIEVIQSIDKVLRERTIENEII